MVHNPRAGPRSRQLLIRDLADRLADDEWEVKLVDDLADLRNSAAALWEHGQLRAVVAAGGDGTVAALANLTPVGTPLLVYPLGTENLIAKYLGYRRRPDCIARLLESGREVAIDAGQADGRLFVLMISVGFDADVVRRVAEARKGNIRRWTYAKPLVAAMRSYGYPELRIHWQDTAAKSPPSDHANHSAVVRWLFGMNLSKYAFGFNFAPEASGTDGLLDVCTFSGGTLFDTFRYAWGLFSRRHLKYHDARMIRCGRLRIEGPDGVEVPYQLDGDFGGYLPVEVCMLPGRLRFIVDAPTADRLVRTHHA